MKNRIKNLTDTGDKDFIEIIKHAFWALIILGIATLLQFLFDLVMARSFGTHGTGMFYLSLSVLMTLALVGRLGLDRAVVRFIPPFLTQEKQGDAKGVVRSSIQLSLIITLPLALLLFLFAPFLAGTIFNEPEITSYLQIFAVAVPAFALVYVFGGILRAMKRTRESLTIERIVIYAIGIIAVLLLGGIYQLGGAVFGFAAAIFISAGVGAWLIAKNLRTQQPTVTFSKKALLRSAAPLLFVVFATQMNGQASVLILGAFADSSAVGIFNIALKVSMLMSLVLTAINVIAATKISELYANGKKKELDTTIRKISALGAVAGLPIFLVLALFPHFLLSLFGQGFIDGSNALIILAFGQLINVTLGSAIFVLAMTDHERSLASAVAISLGINITLGFILIPPFGIMGAAITTTTTLIVSCLIMLLLVKKYLNVWQLPFKTIGIWISKLRGNNEKET